MEDHRLPRCSQGSHLVYLPLQYHQYVFHKERMLLRTGLMLISSLIVPWIGLVYYLSERDKKRLALEEKDEFEEGEISKEDIEQLRHGALSDLVK